MGVPRKRGSAAARSVSSRAAAATAGRSAKAPAPASLEPIIEDGTFVVGPGLSRAHLLELQRTAGNRAVSLVMQRAAGPLDDTWPAVAVADTLPQAAAGGAPAGSQPVPASSGPTGGTTMGTLPPAGSSGPTGGTTMGTLPSPGGGAGGGAGGNGGGGTTGGGAPVALGGPVPAGFAGAVDQTAKRVPMRRDAKPVPEHVVEAIFARDPSRVVRSPSDGWHSDMWDFQKGPGWGDEPPPAFQVGDFISVAPGYAGRATELPAHTGDDRTGLGTPQATPPTPLDTAAPPPERPMIRAIFPGFSRGPEAAGRPTAEAASHEEVLAALAANPRSVVRSPNEAWHQQGYELDLGKGAPPKAYKVEGVIIVAPDYPVEGAVTAPPTATPAAPAGQGAAGGTAPAPSTAVTPAAGTPAAAGAASETGDGGRRIRGDVNVTKDGPGVAVDVLAGHETTEGGTTRKTEAGGTVTVGGGNVVAVGGKHITTETAGDTARTATTSGAATLKPDGSLDLSGKRSRETVVTNAAGEQTKTGSSMSGGVNVGEKGVTLKGGASKTTAAGGSHGATGSVNVDWKGNVSGEAGYEFKTKGGTSLTPSVSGGVAVEAGDPVPAEGGGFDVTYTVTRSSGVSLGGGKELEGGPSASVNIGSTEASLETGTKHFADEKEAKAFRDHAASVIARERVLSAPPTTVDGALQIPIGEERGSGEMAGSSIGGSVALEGASVGYGRSSSNTHMFKVRRTGEKTVEVTGIVSGTKGSDWSISGGLSNTKGSSETAGFEVTWEFNLGTPGGRSAFERYARTGWPPFGVAKMLSVTKRGSEEDHDNVSIPLLGTARWTGTTWEIVRRDAKGTHEEIGGQQAHDQAPSWFGRNVLGQDELHSSAQIVSSLENGKEAGYEAQVKVSGESGDYNRQQLGQMFMGVPHEGESKPSGEWTLSAQVSPEVIRELERNNKEMRQARTKEEKLRIYSKLVKERGAAMVGAQVGLGGDATAWNVELKGDRNFPGAAGRAELERKRAELKERLGRDPAGARSVEGEAQRTLDELEARRTAVADHTKYTDLPDGLRDEQLKLIDKHISDFEFIRHKALQEAIKVAPGEKVEDVRKRMTSKHGYKNAESSAEGAEMARLRDRIADKEGAIKEIDPKILEAINAVQQAQGHTLNMPFGFGDFAREHRASYNQHWNTGVDINDRQMAMAPKADALRMKLLEYLAPADRKSTAEALLALLTDRLTLLNVLYGEVVSAAEALKPITTARGFARHEKFWAGVQGDATPGGGGESD